MKFLRLKAVNGPYRFGFTTSSWRARLWLGLIVVAIGLAGVFGPTLIVLLMVLMVAALLLASDWSLAKRFVIVGLSYFSIVGCLGLVAGYFKLNFSPQLIVVIAILTLGGIVMSRPKWTVQLTRVLDEGDVVGLIAAALSWAVLITPFLGKSDGQRLQILSRGEDNASHFQLFNAITRHQGVVYYERDNSVGVVVGLSHYPQAFHLNASELARMLPGAKVLDYQRVLLRDYAVITTLTFAVFVYLLVMVAMYAARGIGSRKLALATGFIMLPFIHYAAVGNSMFYLYMYGFQPQIAAFALLLGLVLIRLGGLYNKTTVTWISAGLVAGVALTYYFLLPVAGGVLLLTIVRQRTPPKTLAAPGVIFGLFSVIPPALSFVGGQSSVLNAPGGVIAVSPAWTGGFVIVILLLWLTTTGRRELGNYTPLLEGAGLAAVFCVLLGVYQLVTAGKTSYYFDKSVYTFALFGIMLMFVLAQIILGRLAASEFRGWRRGAGFTIAFVAMVVIFYTNRPYFQRMYLSSELLGSAGGNLFNHLIADYPRSLKNNNDIVVAGSCDPIPSYISTRWIGALYLTDSDRRASLLGHILSQGDQPAEADQYVRDMDSRNVAVQVIRNPCKNKDTTE